MREILAEAKELSKQRYMWVVFCVLGLFLLPEYVAPIAAVVAMILAHGEVKATGRRGFLVGETGRRSVFFIAAMLLSVTYSIVPLGSITTVLMFLVMVPAYFALLAVITDKERLVRLFQSLTLCLGVLGVIACVQYVGCAYGGWGRDALQFWNFLDRPVYGLLPIDIRLYSDGVRVASTYSNPNIFAGAMVFLMPLSAYCIRSARHTASRVLFSLCLFAGVWGTAFSFSRASYAVMIGILFLFVLYLVPRVKRPWGVVIFVSAVALVALLALTPNIFSERMQTLNSGDESVSERTQLWAVALSAITERPVFGYGAGIQTTTAIMKEAGLATVPHAHSLYLELLVEGGAVLLMLFFLPVFNVVYTQGDTLFRKRRQPLLGFSVMVSLAGMMAFGLVGFPLFTPKLVGIWWVLFALSDITGAFYADKPLGKLIEKKEETPDA